MEIAIIFSSVFKITFSGVHFLDQVIAGFPTVCRNNNSLYILEISTNNVMMGLKVS